MYGFRKKLLILMLLLTASAMLLTGVPGIFFARQQANNDALAHMKQITRLASSDVEKQFTHIEEVSMALEAVIRSTFDKSTDFRDDASLNRYKQKITPQLREILHLMRPMSLWIVFNTEDFEGRHTISFFDKKGNGVYHRSKEYSIQEKDLFHPSMNWWTRALTQGEIWTLPYYWQTWNMEVISYSRAVYVDSTLIGCLGSDFLYHELEDHLDSIFNFNTGCLILLNEKNELVYSSSGGQPLPDETLELIKQLPENTDSRLLPHPGSKNFIHSVSQLRNGWSVVLSVSRKEIFTDANKLMFHLGIVFLSGFIITILLALYFSKNVTSPVKYLLRKFRRAADGDLDTRANIQTKDEMQELGDHFNKMMEELQKSFNDLKSAQNKLSREKERALESDSLKSSFLENLSHEVRTPLMAIVGFSELMADPASTEKEREDFFSHIAQNSNQLVRFIEDTLLFAQLEKEQAPVRMSQFKIQDALLELKQEFESFRRKQKPDLFFRTLSDDCDMTIYSDPALLKRMIRYLLDNAFKFTDKGGVTLLCRSTDHHFEIIVSDSGIGISDDKTDLVFRKFCKVVESNTRVYDGAGIGLTNARGIALLLNGTIELSSTRGEGTSVKVSFPLNNEV
ncbi:ATP-binding protein [Marinilabilia salmonicolor]|uniref:histidine kinase n=1 Tax=Marinilabilia salmonicolor TaxID=989 RepID=A0A368V8T1_9BACT|nr:ATP-binding protein [Marinilabilia salmonicolor]RCW37528.1 signal transduction histidine kinase [Marinilabilia salmonicolor]